MPIARADLKAELLVQAPGRIEIAHRDDEMIDASGHALLQLHISST
jgi:hypothetical protein